MEKKNRITAAFPFCRSAGWGALCPMKKWLLGLLAAVMLVGILPCAAAAGESTGKETVFVAGNPDLYPFEYYDGETGAYQGILPQLYQQISEKSGLEFVYIHPGSLNRQNSLAKNCQVELVSAHIQGSLETQTREMKLLEYDGGTICIGFTDITPDWMEVRIRSALGRFSSRELLELAVAVPERSAERGIYLWTGITVGVLLVIILALSVVLCRQHKARKQKEATRFQDPLTGIGNALYFEKTFRHQVTHASYALYYVCYIALDVQRVERYLGIAEAEEIQRYGADVLTQTAADGEFAARIGDGVFLMNIQAPTEEAAQDRVMEILNRLNRYPGKSLEEYRVPFRAGVFRMDTANLPVETAVFNARQGYHAAVQEKQACVFADQRMLNREAAKLALQRRLADALSNREFQMYLQMIVDPSGRIVGAEALSRWQNREEGLLLPAMFIEPLNAAGLVDRLDFYVLEEACRQLARWNGTDRGHLWISCNFTRKTISREDFMDRFREVVGKHNFDISRLMIELTEDSLQDNTEVTCSNILQCKQMGCRFALDDLGSGYSSLQDLCDYPIDMIKIDRHILMKASTPRGEALLRGLAKLGHDMGMKVLCEGVENQADQETVLSSGCDFIQGFYHSRALPREEADLFYQRRQNPQENR